MVLGLVVMSKQERNRNASTLLGILVDEIARQEKISDEIESSFDIYPTFYNREVRLFGKIMPDHLLGLLHHLKILKVRAGKLLIAVTKVNEWNSSIALLEYQHRIHRYQFIITRPRSNQGSRQKALRLSFRPNKNYVANNNHEPQSSVSDDEFQFLIQCMNRYRNANTSLNNTSSNNNISSNNVTSDTTNTATTTLGMKSCSLDPPTQPNATPLHLISPTRDNLGSRRLVKCGRNNDFVANLPRNYDVVSMYERKSKDKTIRQLKEKLVKCRSLIIHMPSIKNGKRAKEQAEHVMLLLYYQPNWRSQQVKQTR